MASIGLAWRALGSERNLELPDGNRCSAAKRIHILVDLVHYQRQAIDIGQSSINCHDISSFGVTTELDKVVNHVKFGRFPVLDQIIWRCCLPLIQITKSVTRPELPESSLGGLEVIRPVC